MMNFKESPVRIARTCFSVMGMVQWRAAVVLSGSVEMRSLNDQVTLSWTHFQLDDSEHLANSAQHLQPSLKDLAWYESLCHPNRREGSPTVYQVALMV